MNEVAKKLGAPVLPQVNLIPREFAEKRALRAVQMSALLVVVIAIGVIILAYVLALGAKTLAQNDLDQTMSEQKLALETRDAKVDVYYDALEREQQEYTLAQVGYGEIDYSQMSAALLATASADASFDEVHFFGPSAVGLGLSQAGFYGGGVGSFEFIARTSSWEEATALLARIEAVPGLTRVSAIDSVYAYDGDSLFWQVEGYGIVTDARLTQRLVPEDGLTGIVPTLVAVDGVAVEPTPEPSPEPAAATEEDPDA